MPKDELCQSVYMEYVRQFKSGDETAFNKLVVLLKPHVEICARKILLENSRSGVTAEELIAVGYERLYFVILTINKNSRGFVNYFVQSMRHDMIEYLNDNSYLAKGQCFCGLSLSSETNISGDGLTYSEVLGIKDGYCKEDIYRDLKKELQTPKKYTRAEKEAIAYLILGYGPYEISLKMNKPLSSIYSIVKSAHRKLNNSKLKSTYCH